MISGWRKCKEIERKSFEARKVQKQGSARFRSLRESSAKLALRCETFLQPKRSRCGINVSLRKRPSFAKSFYSLIDSSAKILAAAKIFAAAKPSLARECHFAAQEPPFRSYETAAKLQSIKIPNFATKAPFRRVFRSCETNFGTRVPFRSTVTLISQLRNCCEMAAKFQKVKNPNFTASAKLALRCETISQPKRSRCRINVSLRKRPSFAKSFRNSFDSSEKIFAAAKRLRSYKA